MGTSFDIFLIIEFLPRLLRYFHWTIIILLGALIGGALLGFIVALPRIYNVPLLKQMAVVYVSFIRGTPIIIHLFLFYFGLPQLLVAIGINTYQYPVIFFVILTYAVSMSATFSEIFRASFTSVQTGQIEAAKSVGMTSFQTLMHVIIPQAYITAIPNVGNLVVSGLKDTSLAFSVGFIDMFTIGETLSATTNHFLEVYIALSIIYYAVYLLLQKLFKLIEKRVQKHQLALIN